MKPIGVSRDKLRETVARVGPISRGFERELARSGYFDSEAGDKSTG